MIVSYSKSVVKKSKFIGILYKVSNREDVENILELIPKEHKKADHICSAYLIDDEEKFRNDREVGSPGKILLNLLKEDKLDSHLLVVARYFGGVKLGQGGVQRAFRETGRDCINSKDE